jgi:two-component system, chemotaxis family, chemotaxis protein CheY
MKVLIVDDAVFMRTAIKSFLTKNGFEDIVEAQNGLEGLQKYKELRPDIVTMDITMPEMSGLEALKAIMEFDPKAKVIMVTAMGQEVMVKDAIMYGARSFIVKPFKEDQVINTIKKLLNIA